MTECPICGESLEEKKTIDCSVCGKEVHRDCAKKLSGTWYCKDCKKKGKKRSRYEKMARRDRSFGGGKP
ncbi:MAG: hypothetical protein KGY45_04930 [Hadesarchaea archaeon]|nr:hypothetical protein [Hadesarchaea archaeon]